MVRVKRRPQRVIKVFEDDESVFSNQDGQQVDDYAKGESSPENMHPCSAEKNYRESVTYRYFIDKKTFAHFQSRRQKGIHPVEKPYMCDHCASAFSEPNRLLRQKIHSREECFVCDICEKTCRNVLCLKNHKRVHDRTGEPQEITFEKTYGDSSNHECHTELHSEGRSYRYDVCGGTLCCLQDFSRCNDAHGERVFKCDVRNKVFSLSSDVQNDHIVLTKARCFMCDVCGKAFNHSSHLKEHARVHTKEKPYKCCFCVKAFSHSATLLNHKRLHTGEKPYNCKICDKAFSQLAGLQYHKKTRHSHV